MTERVAPGRVETALDIGAPALLAAACAASAWVLAPFALLPALPTALAAAAVAFIPAFFWMMECRGANVLP